MQSGEDGTFEFARVAPGNWSLVAEYRREGAEFKASSEAAPGYDLDGVRLPLERAFDLDVLVDWQASEFQAIPQNEPQVMLVAADGISGDGYSNGNRARHRINGLFAGRYRITAGFRPGYYLASILLGDREVLGKEVDLNTGSPPIHLIYRSDAARLRGRVKEGTVARVVLIPQDPALGDFVMVARCDPEGRFEISDIRPGDYYAVASNWFDFDALEYPLLVRSVAAHAASVRIGHGETVTVELSALSRFQ